MTSKDFVQQIYPDARAEKQRQGAGVVSRLQKTYWLIRRRGHTMYIASGNTESNAWVNAKKKIQQHNKALQVSETRRDVSR